MTYVTITTWKIREGVDRDEVIATATDRLEQIRDLGALHQMMVAISDTESALISEWPDKATRDSVMAKIETMRAEIAGENRVHLTGEMKGPVDIAV